MKHNPCSSWVWPQDRRVMWLLAKGLVIVKFLIELQQDHELLHCIVCFFPSLHVALMKFHANGWR